MRLKFDELKNCQIYDLSPNPPSIKAQGSLEEIELLDPCGAESGANPQ